MLPNIIKFKSCSFIELKCFCKHFKLLAKLLLNLFNVFSNFTHGSIFEYYKLKRLYSIWLLLSTTKKKTKVSIISLQLHEVKKKTPQTQSEKVRWGSKSYSFNISKEIIMTVNIEKQIEHRKWKLAVVACTSI